MKSVVFFCASFIGLSILALSSGCASKAELDRCVRRNALAQERIEALLAAQEEERKRLEQCQQELELIAKKGGYWQEQMDALQKTLAEKNALIDQLTAQLGQTALPPELSNALADWARGSDLVSYDEKTGIVRFKSDLLFNKGEDTVQADAQAQLEKLSGIMNTPAAEGFDILIVGHTDDLPILKPDTRAKHPSNWHLSAHRAIAVEKILAQVGLAETRQAVMGFGEFRPLEPNAPNKGGNPKNRRVEIYIVPAGQIRISTGPATAPNTSTTAPTPTPTPAAPAVEPETTGSMEPAEEK